MKGSGRGIAGSGRTVLMFRCSEDMKRRVWKAAYSRGISQSDILRLAIQHYLSALDLIKEKSQEREKSKLKEGVYEAIDPNSGTKV